MSLPTTFAGLTAATGAELDNNFAALGNLTTLQCTAAGTNTVVLTQVANSPTVAAYTSLLLFSAVISSTNTGAATLAVGTLSALPVYKDTPAGPVLLTGGEMVAGNVGYWTYDLSLGSGTGGFHLTTQLPGGATAVVATAQRLSGSSAGAVTTAAWTAGEIIAENATGSLTVKGSNLTLAFNGSTTGAGGMDTGAMPTSGQLAIYAIYNPTTATWNTLGYAPGSSVVPGLTYGGANLPSGYAYSALIWVGVTNGSAQFTQFYQNGNRIYVGSTQVLSATAGTANTYASLNLSAVVPYAASTVFGTLAGTSTTIATGLAIAATSAGFDPSYLNAAISTSTLDGYAAAGPFGDLALATPQTLWWKSQNTTQTNVILVRGYAI